MKNFRGTITAPVLLFLAAFVAVLCGPGHQTARAQGSAHSTQSGEIPQAAPDLARMEQVIQSYASKKQFMGSVLVARGGDILFDRSYGDANLEWDIPNSPTTKFRLGSITKQFTAASILLLQERGKLNVQDPVKKYMADAPAAWDKVTIFYVLTHTSGLPDYTNFANYAQLEPFASTAHGLVARFR